MGASKRRPSGPTSGGMSTICFHSATRDIKAIEMGPPPKNSKKSPDSPGFSFASRSDTPDGKRPIKSRNRPRNGSRVAAEIQWWIRSLRSIENRTLIFVSSAVCNLSAMGLEFGELSGALVEMHRRAIKSGQDPRRHSIAIINHVFNYDSTEDAKVLVDGQLIDVPKKHKQ